MAEKKYKSTRYGYISAAEIAYYTGKPNQQIHLRLYKCNHDADIALSNDYWRERTIMVKRRYIYKGINFGAINFAKFFNVRKKYASAWMAAFARGEMTIEESIAGIKSGQTQPGKKYKKKKGRPTKEWLALGEVVNEI